jgi:hypothetical protein
MENRSRKPNKHAFTLHPTAEEPSVGYPGTGASDASDHQISLTSQKT